ncbi:TPA: hypothetical protein ENX78_07865 [Candidatus Poribacteria bacterium]|nr:hypothetical protein [Candidatus Poribacteria bacterium]
MLSEWDFTINKYRELCKTIAGSKYKVLTLCEYLQNPRHAKFDNNVIIMRHDVDRDSRYALETAKVEYESKIRSTYYFRMKKKTFLKDVIDKIVSYGHEIGYHYETLDKNHGDIELARKMFVEELAEFRKRYDVKTVCAHGNPLTKYDNKEIWKSQKLSDYGLVGEAFLSIDGTRFIYFSDSGRTWRNDRSQKMPGKDSIETVFSHIEAKNTDDIIKIIRLGQLPNIYILTHPERWSNSTLQFLNRYFIDFTFILGKKVIYQIIRT